jgi:hypothetical protein
MNVWMDWYRRTEGTMRLPDACLRDVEPRACDECGARLFPGDWLTRDGCTYCDGGLDILTPWSDQ